MNKRFSNLAIVLTLSVLFSSCFVHSYEVGNGPQIGFEVKEKNHYLIYGLARLSNADPIEMAGDTDNYYVTVKHTFIDGLINALTLGIYNPTTTIVTK